MASSTISPMQRTLLIMLTAALAVPTVLAVRDHGFVGIFGYQLETWAGVQVLLDLVIALVLVWVWLWRDAQQLGRNPWPWIGLTLVAGSFGPLFYLMTRKTHP